MRAACQLESVQSWSQGQRLFHRCQVRARVWELILPACQRAEKEYEYLGFSCHSHTIGDSVQVRKTGLEASLFTRSERKY